MGLGAPDGPAIAAAFDLGPGARLHGPVARGEQGQVWRLDTARGSWAVKETFHPVTEPEVALAADLQERAIAAGVSAPRIIRTPAGDVLAPIGAGLARVYSWVELDPQRDDLDARLLGRTLARIHDAGVPTSQPQHPWNTDPVGVQRWSHLAEDLGRAGAPFAAAFTAYLPELVALEWLLEPAAALQITHLDLWPDNVRATDSGVCVIDWENAGPGDPSHELAMVVFGFSAFSGIDRAGPLVQAYHRADGPGRLTGPACFSQVIAQLGHIIEMHVCGWLAAEPGTPQRDRAEAGIREGVEQPLTRRLIDDLLAAAVDRGGERHPSP